MKIAFVGGGAVGASAALIAAKLLPNAKITVIDRQVEGNGLRTFVLLASTQGALVDLGLWEHLEQSAHPLEKLELSFAGMFGGASLSGSDCAAPAIGYSITEPQFISLMRAQLAQCSNVKLIDALAYGLSADGEVSWQAHGSEHSAEFDLVAASGLPEQMLVDNGFAFSSKAYEQLVSVSTFVDNSPCHESVEQLLPGGASILIPNSQGYGHVLMGAQEQVAALAELDNASYLSMLVEKRLTPPPATSNLIARGSYAPRQRLALGASKGRICLLGASACSVHPVGAQELNLGLRDAIELAKLLAEQQTDDARLAERFAKLRAADRSRIAKRTDLAANFIGIDSKLKLCATSVAATALDLLPMARRLALGKAVLP